MEKQKKNRAKGIALAVLAALMSGSLLLIAAGIHAIHTQEASPFESGGAKPLRRR